MDPYVYPGTTVLRNLWDIRDAAQLNRSEAIETTRRSIELEARPTSGKFDANHLKAIHRYIFQDVFDWAGNFRTVNIYKSDPFAFHQFIASCLETTLGELKTERFLSGAGLDLFASRAAHYLGEINAIHPFREGNGRTQREFIRQLAVRNGFAIDWKQVSRQEMIDASRRSLRLDNDPLELLLRKALVPALPRGES